MLVKGVSPAHLPVGPAAADSAGKPKTDFGELIAKAERAVVSPQQNAAAAVQQFARGAEGQLHDTLMMVDKAEISLKFMVNVRNRLIEAYREVMRMGM